MTRLARPLAATAAALALVLVGCADSPSGAAADAVDEPRNGTTSYPLTVDNCGQDVVFDSAPQRVALLESAPVTLLDGLGVLDRVVTAAGSFEAEYYEPDLARRIDEIDKLSEELDAAGHLMISSEVVIAQEPDLVLGLPEGLTREGLRDSDANVLLQPVYCPTGAGDASFDSLYDQVRSYGEIFDRNAEADELVEELTARVAAVQAATAAGPERTAAVLYPSVGGGPLYAYGRSSMAQPQLEAAGFTNVFDDTSDRVFEVSIEELIGRDPEALILLYQGEEAGTLEEVTGLPGSDALRALDNGDVVVQLFNFTEPPSPLSVTGLERIVERLGTGS